jgi:hypothetical protein
MNAFFCRVFEIFKQFFLLQVQRFPFSWIAEAWRKQM